jgi:hypothetical protein
VVAEKVDASKEEKSQTDARVAALKIILHKKVPDPLASIALHAFFR